MYMAVIDKQPLKQVLPSFFVVGGNLISVKEIHLWNTPSPNDTNDSEQLTVAREEQSLNARFPMLVSELGMVIVTRYLLP